MQVEEMAVHAPALLACQTRALELMAAGAAPAEILADVVAVADRLTGDGHCAFVEVDHDGGLHVLAAAGLPGAMVAAIDSLAAGTAGTIDPVDTGDRARASAALDAIAADHGMRGCWTRPILIGAAARPLGIFAIFSERARAATAEDAELLRQFSTLGAVVLSRADVQESLADQAVHDPLTNLPNRTLFHDRLTQALARLDRSHTMLAVLFLDLDRFKLVNDSLGHAAGDQLLVAIAARLASVLRPGDTAARFGGDEFTLLCENLHGPEAAVAIAARVIAALQVPVPLGRTEVVPATSIGIALSADPADTPEALIRNADAAMYTAKERGRGRAELFDDAMRARAVERLHMDTALRRAVERRQLALVYQPEIDLRTGRIVGIEALLRWRHPERGLLDPAQFLPLAEETGLIVPVGGWALEEACHQLAAWWTTLGLHADLDDWNPPLTMRVNLSRRQLASVDLAAEVERVLDAAGTPPHALCLEITEGALMGDQAVVAASVERLRRTGVRIAIDDFGTGYSSLGSLTRLPVDSLKIDRSFVHGLDREHEDTAVVGAVVNLAHSLGLDAVAEGVETAAQLAKLRELGCDSAQGLHLAPPAPPETVEALLRENPTF